jgi:hypothetical protein
MSGGKRRSRRASGTRPPHATAPGHRGGRKRVYYRTPGLHRITVTTGHEAEALAAEKTRRPGRIGRVVLRLLGYRGSLRR